MVKTCTGIDRCKIEVMIQVVTDRPIDRVRVREISNKREEQTHAHERELKFTWVRSSRSSRGKVVCCSQQGYWFSSWIGENTRTVPWGGSSR